ncbi:PAAR-like protein [Enterocloster sp. OA13]
MLRAAALTNDSRLMCSWGGVIQITFPGTVNIQCWAGAY